MPAMTYQRSDEASSWLLLCGGRNHEMEIERKWKISMRGMCNERTGNEDEREEKEREEKERRMEAVLSEQQLERF